MEKRLVHGGDIYSRVGALDFSANINPLGLPSGVKRAIIDNIDSYVSYPDPLCRELKEAISKSSGVLFDKIVCGNGAADLIFRLVLFCKPRKAMVLAPTFAEYEEALKLVDCEIVYHKLSKENGFELDESILSEIKQDIDMVFICNPNNPTGIPVKKEFIIKIAKACKLNNALLMVDECFNEFLQNSQDYSVMPFLAEYENLLVLKAFTKLYSMAGIRLGYMFCACNIAQGIAKTLQPWSVSTVASKCGVAALLEEEYRQKTYLLTKQNREYLITELKLLSFKVYASRANFVFFWSEDISLAEKLQKRNILIRECDNYVGLTKGYYRIAVLGMEDNVKLIEAIKGLRVESNG